MENASSVNFSEDHPLLLTYGERVGVAVLILIIFVVGSIGNSIVILAVVLSKGLQTVSNVFVVSLAVADLCYCLLLPLSNATALLALYGWPFESEILCTLSALMAFTSAGASMNNLACIAINRLLVIRGPMTAYKWLFTPRKIIVLVISAWVIPLSAMLIPPAFGIGEFGYDEQDNTCSDIDTHPLSKEYHLIQVICFYPVPLYTIIICYSLLFVHIKRHFKHREESFRESHEMAESNKTDDRVHDELEARFKKRVHQRQLQITKNLFMVSCAFVLCTAPYSLAVLVTSDSRALVFLSVLFTCNSCINPILYTVNHPRFNVVIRCILGCRLRDIPKPSKLLVAVRARCMQRSVP